MNREIPEKAASVLKNDGIAVLATDTIYGILGRALNEDIVERIYTVRGRKHHKSCIILISSEDDLNLFSIIVDPKTKKILKRLWPGPVSIILPCTNEKFAYLHKGKKDLAFRVPDNPELIQLLKQTGPLLAPSANKEGDPPAKNIEEAQKYFGDDVDLYFDGGEVDMPPSTVIKIVDGEIFLIRKGAVTVDNTDSNSK
ncbi:MAG: threonylcarbamoyl-AMP synthase [Candidatus Pacebacteria bacterium]|nr:threonylcarbamoyl-AMP synthase [Candidatus Paceibacterota bacterium]